MSSESFPVGSSVLLQNLVKGAQYNDKKGIVRSRLNASSGRQEVYVFEANKSMAIKPINMRYEPREISSLSISEMKGLLLASKICKGEDASENVKEPDQWKGLDKEQLRQMVAEVTTSPEEIAALVAKANEPKELPSSINAPATQQPTQFTSDQLRQSAERMSQMSPEALRQQAATMKSMGPAALRSMNPQMARMTDEQIHMAIAQMEAVANNPAMMKMAAEQMKNMSAEEFQAAVGSEWNASSYNTTNNAVLAKNNSNNGMPTSVKNMPMSQFQEGAQKMSSMTPEQLKSQATLLKSMPLDTLRRTNPHMASMTDDQIRTAIDQMGKMAEDPAMLKLAAEQMKNMSWTNLQNLP